MKRTIKNIVQITPARPVERKNILESTIASFRIEGIFLPDAKIRSIYDRVNEKLRKECR